MRIRSVLSLVLLLPLLTSCSMALKGGVHTFSEKAIENVRDNPSLQTWGFEFGLHKYLDDRLDLALGVDFVQSVPGTDFQDYRLTTRYNFKQRGRFRPYAGGGVGYFRMFSKSLTVIPLDCLVTIGNPNPGQCPQLELENETTLASGFGPHAIAGFSFNVAQAVDIVVEDRFDFARDDQGINFDANQINAGIRFEWY